MDYVQLMTYDMVDGTRAGHHAALGATKGDKSGLNTRDTVEAYHRAGVPYEKLVIGAAFYGRHFAVTSFENHMAFCSPSGGGLPGPTYGRLPRNISGRTISRFIGMLMRRQIICGTAGLSSAMSPPRGGAPEVQVCQGEGASRHHVLGTRERPNSGTAGRHCGRDSIRPKMRAAPSEPPAAVLFFQNQRAGLRVQRCLDVFGGLGRGEL